MTFFIPRWERYRDKKPSGKIELNDGHAIGGEIDLLLPLDGSLCTYGLEAREASALVSSGDDTSYLHWASDGIENSVYDGDHTDGMALQTPFELWNTSNRLIGFQVRTVLGSYSNIAFGFGDYDPGDTSLSGSYNGLTILGVDIRGVIGSRIVNYLSAFLRDGKPHTYVERVTVVGGTRTGQLFRDGVLFDTQVYVSGTTYTRDASFNVGCWEQHHNRGLSGVVNTAFMINGQVQYDLARELSEAPYQIIKARRELWSVSGAGGSAVTIAQAIEANTAAPLSWAKTMQAGLASTSNSGFAVDPAKALPIDLSLEAATAHPVNKQKTLAAGLATEADSAFLLSSAAAVLLAMADETDTANPTAIAKVLAVNMANETSSAFTQAWGKQLAAGLASETNSAFSLDGLSTLAIGLASETSTASNLIISKTLATGLAIEAGTALPMAAGLAVVLGMASEADSVLALDWAKALSIGLAEQTAAGFAMLPAKQLTTGLASETDSAFDVSATTAVVLGLATELDGGLSVVWSKQVAIGQAVEIDSATALLAGAVLVITGGDLLNLPLKFSKLNLPLKHDKLTLH